jgi:uncharacterized membrane protein
VIFSCGHKHFIVVERLTKEINLHKLIVLLLALLQQRLRTALNITAKSHQINSFQIATHVIHPTQESYGGAAKAF